MAIGTTTAIIAAGLLGAGAAAGIGAMNRPRSISSPTPLPQPPSPEASAERSKEVIRRTTANMTKSVYTSPLGVAGEAQVAKKTLLGQ